MSTARRIVTALLSVITTLLALWTLVGWITTGSQGSSWSDAIAITVFSIVLLILGLVCTALWRTHVRWLSLTFGIVSALAAVSLVASLIR